MISDQRASVAEWECVMRAPNYDDDTLREIHDQIADNILDGGEMQGYALELIAQIRKDARELHASRAEVAVLLDQYNDRLVELHAMQVERDNLRTSVEYLRSAIERHLPVGKEVADD